MKKLLKSCVAVAISLLTAAQFVLPTYAVENDTTISEATAIRVEVSGDGEVQVTSDHVDQTVNKDQALIVDAYVGDTIHFDVKEQDVSLLDFQLDGVTLSEFNADMNEFSYDYVVTESDATFQISFDTLSETEQSGVSTEKEAAKDADIGTGEGDQEGIAVYKAAKKNFSQNAKTVARASSLPFEVDGTEIVEYARRWNHGNLGWIAYGHGSSPMSGLDCAGYVTLVYRYVLNTAVWSGTSSSGSWTKMDGGDYGQDRYGISRPGLMNTDMWQSYLDSRGVSYQVDGYSQAKPGDIIFFYTSNNGSGSPIHMGIYTGNGNVIDCAETKAGPSGTISVWGISETPISYVGNKDGSNLRSYRIYRTSAMAGKLSITKKSSNTGISTGNSLYSSMEGAQYGLYSDSAATKLVGTFTIQEDGSSNTIDNLSMGTYYIKETKAPEGYALDPTIHAVTISSSDTVWTANDFPQNDPVGILLGKVDAETNSNKPQGSASLADAQFTVKYYDGYYDTEEELSSVEPTRQWVLKTDENGMTILLDSYVISGDELYYNSNGDPTLPLGTLTIQETKAPEGYLINDELFIRQITSEGIQESVETYNEPIITEQVALGDFSIYKIKSDKNESSIAQPEEGAEFTAIYKGYVDQYGSFEEALKHTSDYGPNEWSVLTTDETGHTTSGKLAYGSYVVKQTKASDAETGMLNETFEVTISNDGDHAEYTINNVPMDYYVKIVKKDAESGKIVSLNNATFQIKKYDETGDVDANYNSAYMRTDENGIVSVKNGLFWYNQFTTNADNRLSIIESIGKYEGTTSEDKGSVTVPQKFTAGEYEIQEIETPDGYLSGENLRFTLSAENIVETDEDGDAFLTVEYSDEKPTGRIELTKLFEDPDTIMHGEVTFDLFVTQEIVDPADGTVLYKAGDKYGTYTLDKENNTIVIEGLPMGVGESHFKLVEASTYENYQLNTEEYAIDFVQTDDTTTTYTAEVTVENELIHIGTTALNADTEGKEFNSAKEITITDTVSYEGLIPNQEYTMRATLINKETGEAVLNEDGTQVEGYKKFTPTEASGTVDVTMTLDASQLGGQDYVVFESLLNTGLEGHEGCEIAKHEDLTDEDQTITILDSKIGTLAQSENGSHEQQVKDGEITLTDTVSYEGLVPGMNYKVSGTLMNKETGEPLIDAEGNEITAETTFNPEESNGTVDVVFTFDATELEAGTSVVVFETLYEVHTDDGVSSEIEVSTHEDLEDEGQTIDFIDIHTNASSENGINEQQAIEDEVTLTDTVTYEGLKVGEEYTVSGTLMNKETGEPLIDAEGNEITAETTFTPEEPNGTVDVVFTFDLTGVNEGTDIVVFENLYHDGIEVAVHTDLEDEDQTIHIINLHTEALSENDTHTALAGEDIVITDVVTYTNLEPGKEYTVKGKLMDKETGEPLIDAEGNEITAETTFTPEEPDGTVNLIYTLDASELEGKEIVVFEDLYKDDKLVGTHSDLEDENQTILFKDYEIVIQKVDSATGQPITSGFEFTVYSDSDCKEELETFKPDESGKIQLSVEKGVVYIKETKAPDGYQLSDEVVKVEVKDDLLFVNDQEVEVNEDYIYSFNYKNTPVPNDDVDTSAQIGAKLLATALCASGIGALGLTAYNRKKKNKKA